MNTLLENSLLIYLIPLLFIWVIYTWSIRKKRRAAIAVRDEALESGLTEPASLHPVINHSRCQGCGSCISACPEQPGHTVLGLIGGKSHLINPTECIGHGACKTACPHDAITLVFGTEKRGVDIPLVKPTFETNVPGIYIAGELGGMGLIRNAIEQGRQALESIKKSDGIGKGPELDVLIVGAGPAGFAASLGAMEHKMRYVTIEQDSLGGTVFHFPRGKLVLTAPVVLPMTGKMEFTETTKEALLDFWQKVERKTGVKINYKERVEKIVRRGGNFEVATSKGTYTAKKILLTIGRRGTPRKLGVPGEELPKVVYSLIDAEQYRGQHVLVVGGGDSAIEAATSIAAELGTTVTLSYRSGSFSRAKAKNREKISQAEADGRVTVLMNSNVKRIEKESVVIEQEGKLLEIENGAVIINAGGILPTAFLKEIGITVETKYGTAA